MSSVRRTTGTHRLSMSRGNIKQKRLGRMKPVGHFTRTRITTSVEIPSFMERLCSGCGRKILENCDITVAYLRLGPSLTTISNLIT